jgi:hypothetical protein
MGAGATVQLSGSAPCDLLENRLGGYAPARRELRYPHNDIERMVEISYKSGNGAIL